MKYGQKSLCFLLGGGGDAQRKKCACKLFFFGKLSVIKPKISIICRVTRTHKDRLHHLAPAHTSTMQEVREKRIDQTRPISLFRFWAGMQVPQESRMLIFQIEMLLITQQFVR